ncbi:MAG TPA: hypothetical protein VGQ76_16190 [Thermoanaerobaculia bacterium]|jgi:hypothetical protein|nr:hypothetical protein [Thermoanaerobaculia bacterium]
MKRLAVPIVIALALCFLMTSNLHAQPNPGFEQNSGAVKRLYPEPNRTYFSLTGGSTAMNPTNGYYFVPRTHPNYDAMLRLLYLAAEKRWTLKVRTQPALDASGAAEVIYFVVDF